MLYLLSAVGCILFMVLSHYATKLAEEYGFLCAKNRATEILLARLAKTKGEAAKTLREDILAVLDLEWKQVKTEERNRR